MPKRKGVSETKEENLNQKGFNLNECASSPSAELMISSKGEKIGMEQGNGLLNENFSESCFKVECETDSLVKDVMDNTPNDGNMENVSEMKNEKAKLEPLDCEVSVSGRVLRSGSVARDPVKINKHHGPVKYKGKGAHKEDLGKDDNTGNVSGISSVDEVKGEVKQDHVKDSVPKETHENDSGSQIKVEYRSDEESGGFEPHVKEVKAKRKRGRPPKLQISSQSDDDKEKLVKDDKEEKLIGGSCYNEAKTEVKLEHGQSAEAKKIPGAYFTSQADVEVKDERSYDENGNFEPHDEEPKVKRKRGRPRKLPISSQSNENDSNTNCKLARTPDLSRQSSVDRLILKRQCDRPPKIEETAVGLYIKKENGKRRHGSTVITSDQSMRDSIDESSRPKSNYGGRVKGPGSDVGNCRGRKMVRKRGRPPTPQKKRKYGETGESNYKAKKRLKLHDSPLESRHNNPLMDGERRIGEEQQNGAVRQSISKSKKMLSDKILQLLLAAGWTVEYRPRNGKDYKDAVYLNPEGKTHWSVTKAYTVYKNHLESSMKDQVNSTTGSSFGLLPEEDLHLLGRNQQKKRSDKGKQRAKWKDGETHEKEKIRMQKKRKGSHGSHRLERISVSVRKIKREEKHKRKRCALSARSSLEDTDSKENGYILFEGKRTLLGWMIDSAIVTLNGKVQCMDRDKTQVLLEGKITKEGIQCNCCDTLFSVLDFEVHAGEKCNHPFKSLYLEGGNPLLQCLLESWNKQNESQLKGFHFVDFGGGDPNDDTCGICGDGGDLICCDGCPSTFHQSCLDIKKFPSGAWFCCYCSCKLCEKVEAANHDTATVPPLSNCRLCEEKYHQACIVPGERSTDSFCGKSCQELFDGLELLIGVKHPLPEGFSWTFLRRFGLPNDVSYCEISEKIVYNAKLAVAFSVMDECFSPLVDHRSGVNLLENIVYNFDSNFHRLNYSSFLTAVLERGDEIIAVASIRIHGNQLAEMPFIGTRYMYRHQGMCRRLMNGIESALGSLKVDKLVIPAVPELIDTWTSGFGFKPVLESDKKPIKNLNLLVFPGLDMLEKSLVKEKIAESNVSSSNGYLTLAPEMSLPVDAEENKAEESKDNANEQNCATADVKSPSDPVDSCLKSINGGGGGDNDTESNLNLNLEESGKVTDKDIDSLPDVVDDNQRESDDSHTDQTDTKGHGSGDLEDNKPLLDDGRGVNVEVTEESDEQSDCYIIDNSQPLSNGVRTSQEIDNKTLAVKKEVTTTLRASPRLVQRSWRTSPVNQKYTGANAVLLDSSHQCL